MNLFTIPFKNMRTKPAKTALLLLAFSLGVTSIVSLYQVSLVVGHSLEKKLSAYGANIIIKPVAKTLSVSYGGFHMGDMLLDVEKLSEKRTHSNIKAIELNDRISIIAPKLVAVQHYNEEAIGVVGVLWEDELAIKSYWALNGKIPDDPRKIVLGSNAATKLNLSTGDTLSLFDQTFTVAGVLYETGGDDDAVILMDLHQLQHVTDQPDTISFTEVAALCSGCPIEDIVGQLQNNLPYASVIALQKVVNQRMSSIKFVQKLALIVSIVILITASMMVGLSMLTAVTERMKEIGILRSLGYSKPKIFHIFCIEAGVIGFLSGLTGYLVGFGVSIEVLEILTLADGIQPHFSFEHLVVCSLLFPVVTITAAVYPAWKGASIEPTLTLVSL